tara:strand:+ start:341 stop:535 length:195 start_codon:yes stop_codon:yes gene_type:complete
MKIIVDLEKCYKSGECYYNHPELFEMDEDGYPKVLVENVTDGEFIDHARQAIEVCPAVAISMEE